MTLGTDCTPLLAPATLLLNSYSVWFWISGPNCAFYCHQSCRNLKASPGCTPLGLNWFSQKYTHAVVPHPYWSTHAPTLKTNRHTPPNPTNSEEWSACGEVVVKSWSLQNLLPLIILLMQLAPMHAVHCCLDMRDLANLPSGWGRYAIKVLVELS